MAESAAITGFGGYVMAGFCILGTGVMIGFLLALVIEGWEGRRRRELIHGDADEVGGE